MYYMHVIGQETSILRLLRVTIVTLDQLMKLVFIVRTGDP